MGLFDDLASEKSNLSNNQTSVDYIRVNLLAKLGEENIENEKYHETINYIHEFFQLMGRNSFPDLQNLIQPCYFNLALAYSYSGDHENAVAYWTKFIQTDKSNFHAYFERLQSYLALNKLNEALLDID